MALWPLALASATAEGITLPVSSASTAGYKYVRHRPDVTKSKPFHASVKLGKQRTHVGSFVCAEEAALAAMRWMRANARLPAEAGEEEELRPLPLKKRRKTADVW